MQKNCNPVIVFSFSKRECERNALEMVKFKFSSVEEEDFTANIFNSAVDNLSVEDRQLPQIKDFLPLLKRGIGIHHSGLLPILKEVIEILFQEGLIKVLFATETFSIGLKTCPPRQLCSPGRPSGMGRSGEVCRLGSISRCLVAPGDEDWMKEGL
ncbi:hypothetical protein EDD85DRAFT_959514 [Armillaria nabsnona]|nr:hypothetical protein EDD85DRAFT_959514 [Armillaria nabsnona]